MFKKWQRYRIRIISFVGALLLAIAFNSPAQAHWADLSVAEIVVGETQTQVTLTFPTGLVASADDDRDGQLSSEEVGKHQTQLQATLGDRLRLTNDNNQPGKLAVQPSNTANLPANLKAQGNTHSTLLLIYTWQQPIQDLKIDYNLFLPGVSTARCVATIVQAGKLQNFVFTPENREFSLNQVGIWQQLGSFIILGVEHILTGYDHVLFLISLLMLGGGLPYLLKIVTAFTISHSVTLSLAVLNVVTLPSRWVESAIALTIVYVAAENFWRKDLRWRWLITFGFGLIHGLGFAGILKDINITQSNLAISLVGFNVGVEIGQIFIVSAAFLLLRRLQQSQWELKLRYLVSAGVVALGTFWFVERAFFAA